MKNTFIFLLYGILLAFLSACTPSPTPTPMPTATALPTSTALPTATATPTPAATSTPTSTATATAINTPTSLPTATATRTETLKPTATATVTSTPSREVKAIFGDPEIDKAFAEMQNDKNLPDWKGGWVTIAAAGETNLFGKDAITARLVKMTGQGPAGVREFAIVDPYTGRIFAAGATLAIKNDTDEIILYNIVTLDDGRRVAVDSGKRLPPTAFSKLKDSNFYVVGFPVDPEPGTNGRYAVNGPDKRLGIGILVKSNN